MPAFPRPAAPRRSRTGSLALLLVLGMAGGAAADDGRCTGTMCDLYYTMRPDAQPQAAPAAQQPAAATPVTVPSTGGILNFFKGSPSSAPAAPGAAPAAKPFMYLTDGTKYDRCTGTLCDVYYGATSGSSDKPAAQKASTAASPGGTVLTPARPAPTPEQVALAKSIQQRRAAQEAREQERAKCRLAGAGDPWHCFR